jgi:hypothetical protein
VSLRAAEHRLGVLRVHLQGHAAVIDRLLEPVDKRISGRAQ